MHHKKPGRSLMGALGRIFIGFIFGFIFASFVFVSAVEVSAEQGYPDDYTPSKPADQGETNVLARFGAVSTYMNDKLEAAGGNNSPVCFRNCLTVPVNEILDCLEKNNTYETSKSCEQDAAKKMAACDPKC